MFSNQHFAFFFLLMTLYISHPLILYYILSSNTLYYSIKNCPLKIPLSAIQKIAPYIIINTHTYPESFNVLTTRCRFQKPQININHIVYFGNQERSIGFFDSILEPKLRKTLPLITLPPDRQTTKKEKNKIKKILIDQRKENTLYNSLQELP
jgi:hypothetical protein